MADTVACSAGKTGPVLSMDAARLRSIAVAAPLGDTEEMAQQNAQGRIVAQAVPPGSLG